jgi:ADP-ribosyl-[dinitrogen reductase] hydrolase
MLRVANDPITAGEDQVESDYTEPLRVATEAALAAGGILREEFHRPGGPRGSHGKCSADRQAEDLIRQMLTSAFPDWGYMGEETGYAPGSPSARHSWLVDPNDGTSAYLRGWRGTAVSIALLREGTPVLGVVYAFAAPDDWGDLISWAEGSPLMRHGVAIDPEDHPVTPSGAPGIVLVSQYADDRPVANLECLAPLRYRAVPSIAYRLALVAAGEATAGVSLNSPVSWDYAGGHALLKAVGGELFDDEGKPITYESGWRSSTLFCFGGAPSVVEQFQGRPWKSVFGPDTSEKVAGLPAPVRLAPGGGLRDAEVLTRAQGCLMGQLVGDTLGAQVEFQPAESLRSSYPSGLRLIEDGGLWGTQAGQPTDDSEMALMLARSLVAQRGYDVEAVARAYGHWYQSHPFDMGGTTSQALGAAAGQEAAAEAAMRAASRSSQANGSLMRISPLGIYGHALPAGTLADLARLDSSITHPHPVCQESCAVFTVALARAIARGGSPAEVYRDSMEWAESNCREEAVLSTLRRAASDPPADYGMSQGWVLIALQNAFYQLLHAESLEEGVVDTVMAGGDTDTNAAIAGALLGAVNGLDEIPVQWKSAVLSCRPVEGYTVSRHPRPQIFWPVDALELAEVLATITEPSAG